MGTMDDDWIAAFAIPALLRIKPGTARSLAHREAWRRTRRGRQVWYWADDVAATLERRAAHRAEHAND